MQIESNFWLQRPNNVGFAVALRRFWGTRAAMSILVQDYYKVYGQTVAADGITFSVAPGEILGLVGPNGAGKTTTLRAMAGILAPTRGRIVIAGHEMAREPVAAKS